MATNLEWVSARSMAPHAPFDLKTLCFHRRPPAGQTVRLYAVGDIGLFGRAKVTAEKEGFPKLFQEAASLLHTGDIVFGNLETPLLDWFSDASCFAGGQGSVESLKVGGFTLLHLANNHIHDFGPRGLASTLQNLREAGIAPLGAADSDHRARQLVRTDKKGLRIGWLGCGRTLQHQGDHGPRFWEFDHDELLSAVRQARSEVDVLIVSIHTGLMYLDFPHPVQKTLAERMLAERVNLVLMHHAHVLQGVQTRNGCVICHSLGNFLFDSQGGAVRANVMKKEQEEGAVFLFDLDRKGVCLAAAMPTYADDDCCVRWATGPRGTRILSRLASISVALENGYLPFFWGQRLRRHLGITIRLVWHHVSHGNWAIVVAMLVELLAGFCREAHLDFLMRFFGRLAGRPLTRNVQDASP